MSLRFQDFKGPEIEPILDAFAHLRIAIFRDWPYLYDGDFEYERRYLADYAQGDAILVGAFDGDRLVGAATGMPLTAHADDFAKAFEGHKIDFSTVFYCAESVLLPTYRGQGAGHAFFDRREAHARALGYEASCFCGVLRPADHPARPADYRPLDPFWRAKGYAPLPDVIARFKWRDIGDSGETEKPLQFWMRRL